MALLHFLHSRGQRMLVASFNHNLRSDAQADVEFVRATATGLGLPFVTAAAEAGAYSSARSLSIEEAARELRYRFLFSEARKAGAGAVAVGHTADDQAETVLMHFLRGAGLAGLKGMPPSLILPVFDSAIPLVRPLLNWTRADTEAYCREHNLHPRSDSTNADRRYFRNRLRLELLPLLEAYNPQIRQTLARTATSLRADFELLNGLVEEAWKKACLSAGTEYIEFKIAEIEMLGPALSKHLFRRAAFQLRPALRDVDFEALERAASLQPVDLAGGLKTYREGGSLYLTADIDRLPSRNWPQLGEPFTIEKSGSFDLGNGWRMNCQQISAGTMPAGVAANADPWAAWLDGGLAARKLHVRSPLSGDRFEPLGMPRQSVKITDLFINLKIPKRLRAHWPLVCAGDVIVWVPGLRLAESCKVSRATREAIKLEFRKNEGQV